MRSKVRRRLLGLGLIAAASTISVLATAAPAHAGRCYTIGYGNNSVTICPWD